MKRLSLLAFCLFFSIGIVHSQNEGSSSDSTVISEKNGKLQVMPFLSYNRNLKFMIGAIPMYMYKLNKEDLVSPKSLSGLAAVYTTNNSYFISFFNRMFFNEDKWRLTVYGVTGDNNSQFFMENEGVADFYDYGTETTMISTLVQRKVSNEFYLGVGYTYSNYYTVYEDDVQEPSTTITNGLEFSSLYDTRNAIYYPTKGVKAKLNWLSYPEWFSNELSANKIKTEYNQYFGIKEGRDVIAARVSGIFGLGDIAFEQQVTIGGKDIRGYSQGQFRGDGMVALQGEYRYNFHPKMGLVGFAGLATIYGSDTESFDWNLYPGAGVGYRYKAFSDVNFNIGLDAAVGKDDWGIYFRIGEAF
ncbi:BamA/TamA family outer membrane protein [Algoriphagus aestuarii]|nr:BamA/TamA family outer membrane protein [Algoriphagus aestuarii]